LVTVAALAGFGQFATTTLELWTAFYVANSLGVSSAAGAATFTAMTIAGIVSALGADRVVRRIGDLATFRLGSIVASVALAVALAVGDLPVTVAGFVIFSIGTCCAGPSIRSFAGGQHLVSAGEAISVLELGDSVGAFIAPAFIGTLAAALGLRISLGMVVITTLLAALIARRAVPVAATA
jgi:hypothetical protein